MGGEGECGEEGISFVEEGGDGGWGEGVGDYEVAVLIVGAQLFGGQACHCCRKCVRLWRVAGDG